MHVDFVATPDDLMSILAAHDIACARDDDDTIVVRLASQNAELPVRFARTGDVYQIIAALPLHAPAESYESASAVVCAVNDGLPLPGFAIDARTGHLSYRIAVPLTQQGLPAELVVRVLATIDATVDANWAALTNVADAS
jgi:hypothetical protein